MMSSELRKKSSSTEQQYIEEVVISRIRNLLDIPFEKNSKISVGISSNTYIQPDFYSKEEMVIGEVYAHIGTTKSAQDKKLANDILKMLLLDRKTHYVHRKIIVVCDDKVSQKLKGKGWLAECIREYDIEILQVELTTEERELVINAQKRQKMINA